MTMIGYHSRDLVAVVRVRPGNKPGYRLRFAIVVTWNVGIGSKSGVNCLKLLAWVRSDSGLPNAGAL